MKTRNPVLQVVMIALAASVIAIVANGFSGRTRKLVLPGYYPNALRVPPRVPDPVTPAATPTPVTATTPMTTLATDTTATAATATTPIAAVPVPTATVAPPVTATVATTTSPALSKPAVMPKPAAAPPAATAGVDLSRFQPHPDTAFVEISGAEAAALHAAGTLFLDARRTSVFEAGHIAGARSFSVWESDIDEKVNGLFSERSDPSDQNKPIVIYCSGGACEDSHMLAQKLWGIQFNNLYVYKDGFPDWQNRNGAVKTGGQP
jgi:rhodanese-related sulfurtransferase